MGVLTAGEDDPFDVCFVGEFVPDGERVSQVGSRDWACHVGFCSRR